MSIGEFARQSRLSANALRLYDELGLLRPARVDAGSGYRYYEASQLEQARLVAALRQLQIPLAGIKSILGLEPPAAAERIGEYWAAAEAEHSARRDLAGYLVNHLSGKRPAMQEVTTRDIPSRSLLCLKRSVDGQPGAWTLGKEFVALLQARPLPRMEGRAGAAFCIYWGEVSEDSDGPIEWCRPVPHDRAEVLAAEFPELSLRTEPAHRGAFVHLGPGGQISPAQWQMASQSLHAWADEHSAQPSELGVRVTFLTSAPATEVSPPDCDFAVPIS
ncbi:MAG: MerR family transcriptional regulator [Streptosporangiaceae bacterium]|jgi:DNA-binding transcriptional MerR regulator